MKASMLFRIAAVLLLLFAAGHTYGFLTFKPPTEQGLGVRESMDNVHFAVKGSIYSYGEFYRGMGLTVTAYLIFSAFLAWRLASMAVRVPRDARIIGVALILVQLIGLALSSKYFSAPPAIFCAIVAVFLSAGVWLTKTDRRPGSYH